MSSRNNNNSLMKRELQVMLAQGSPRIALAENTMRRRSCIWNYYKRVLLDGEDQPFASCNYCGTLVHYSSKHGTGSLLRHKCNTYSVSLYTAGGEPGTTAANNQHQLADPTGTSSSTSRVDKRLSTASSSSSTMMVAGGGVGQMSNGAVPQPRAGRASSKMASVPTRRGSRMISEVSAAAVAAATCGIRSVSMSNANTATPTIIQTSAFPSSSSRNMPMNLASVASAVPSCGMDDQLLMSTLAEKQVAFIVKDLRPIDTTDGAGFLELAQALMEVAAAESGGGPVPPVCDVLVAQPLLAGVYIPRMVERLRSSLATEISCVERLAMALDVWNNDAGRRFVTLSATYVTDDFELKSAVLGTRDLSAHVVAPSGGGNNGDESGGGERKFRVKTEEGAAVVRAMLDIVSQYTGSVESAAEKLAAGAVITDDGNLYAALADATATRLLCPCRALNSILDEVLSPTGRSASPAWRQLCRDCDALIEYLRCYPSGGVSEHLHATKRPLTERRALVGWSDVYDALVGVRDHHAQLLALLAEGGQQAARLMHRLTVPVLDEVVAFLDLFKECLESLCVDSYPTINECVLWKLKLEKHCATAFADNSSGTAGYNSSSIASTNTSGSTNLTGSTTATTTVNDSEDFPNWLREVQRTLREKLKHSLGLDKLCSVALLLDPNFKSLRMLAETDRKWAKEVTMSYMRDVRNANAAAAICGNSSLNKTSGDDEADSAEDSHNDRRRRQQRQRLREHRTLETSASLRDVDSKMKPPPAHQQQRSLMVSAADLACCEPPSKRARSLLNFTEFLQGADEEQAAEDPVETELRRYVELRVAGDQLGDVLLFWKTAGAQFPLLRHLAKWVLAIPACSSVKHCPFSSPGRILEQRRRALNSCVDQIVFLPEEGLRKVLRSPERNPWVLVRVRTLHARFDKNCMGSVVLRSKVFSCYFYSPTLSCCAANWSGKNKVACIQQIRILDLAMLSSNLCIALTLKKWKIA